MFIRFLIEIFRPPLFPHNSRSLVLPPFSFPFFHFPSPPLRTDLNLHKFRLWKALQGAQTQRKREGRKTKEKCFQLCTTSRCGFCFRAKGIWDHGERKRGKISGLWGRSQGGRSEGWVGGFYTRHSLRGGIAEWRVVLGGGLRGDGKKEERVGFEEGQRGWVVYFFFLGRKKGEIKVWILSNRKAGL